MGSQEKVLTIWSGFFVFYGIIRSNMGLSMRASMSNGRIKILMSILLVAISVVRLMSLAGTVRAATPTAPSYDA